MTRINERKEKKRKRGKDKIILKGFNGWKTPASLLYICMQYVNVVWDTNRNIKRSVYCQYG